MTTRIFAPVLGFALLAALGPRAAAEEPLVTYTLDEIEQFITVFKSAAKDKKQPEDDAVTVLKDLKKAYTFLDSKSEEEATKDEEKLKKKLVKVIAEGLRARDRPMVNVECARVLGEIGDKGGARPLATWMEKTVLDMKTPSPLWVEHGFVALAKIGDERTSLDLFFDYGARAKHRDYGVADKALQAVVHWRSMDGKVRKDMFEKVLQLLQSLESQSRQGGGQAQTYKERFERVEANGMRALQELSGAKLANIAEYGDWYNDNKRANWEDYVGVDFREAPKKEEKAEGEEKS